MKTYFDQCATLVQWLGLKLHYQEVEGSNPEGFNFYVTACLKNNTPNGMSELEQTAKSNERCKKMVFKQQHNESVNKSRDLLNMMWTSLVGS